MEISLDFVQKLLSKKNLVVKFNVYTCITDRLCATICSNIINRDANKQYIKAYNRVKRVLLKSCRVLTMILSRK